MKRGSATCPCCGYTTPVARSASNSSKARAAARIDARLLLCRHDRDQRSGTVLPASDRARLRRCCRSEERTATATGSKRSTEPQCPTSHCRLTSCVGISVCRSTAWTRGAIFFTPRQMLALTTLCSLVRKARQDYATDDARGLRNSSPDVLGGSRLTSEPIISYYFASLDSTRREDSGIPSVARHLPMVWDFAEANPIRSTSLAVGHDALTGLSRSCEPKPLLASGRPCRAASATAHPLPDDSADAHCHRPAVLRRRSVR